MSTWSPSRYILHHCHHTDKLWAPPQWKSHQLTLRTQWESKCALCNVCEGSGYRSSRRAVSVVECEAYWRHPSHCVLILGKQRRTMRIFENVYRCENSSSGI